MESFTTHLRATTLFTGSPSAPPDRGEVSLVTDGSVEKTEDEIRTVEGHIWKGNEGYQEKSTFDRRSGNPNRNYV